MYEFVCERCGERFEALTGVGAEFAECRACGADGAKRVMSAPGRVPRLAKSPGESRKLEDKRGVGRDGARQRFKEARRSAREAAARRERGRKR